MASSLPDRYARWLVPRVRLVLAFCAVVTVAAIVLATRLRISTDLWALLPRDYPSVQALLRLSSRVGGFSTLNIAVESPDPVANQRFADALVPALRRELGDEILTIDYKVDEIRDFYERHAAVYLARDELEALDRDLVAAIHEKKVKAVPIYDLGIADPTPAFETPEGRLRARLHAQTARFDKFPNGYYSGEDGRLLAIFVRPKASSGDPRNARAFLTAVDRIVATLSPIAYHPSLKVGYTGTFQVSLDEQTAIVRDLASTAGLCIALIALVVVAYFRSLRVVTLLFVTLLCGVAWAFGLARLAVGFLNIQTAFLGSIIAGTGINYGIILAARYLEERQRGRAAESAIATAVHRTFVATLTAALTTAISFATLLSSSISSFEHFAIIGGGGILFCWGLTYTLLPALLIVVGGANGAKRRVAWPAMLARLPVAHPLTTTVVASLLALGGGAWFVHYLPRSLETDGRNLRTRSSLTTGAAKLSERISKFRVGSGSPGLVVTDSLDDARAVCEVVKARIAREGKARAPFNDCKSVFTLLPTEQAEKLAIARRILQHVDEIPDRALDEETRRLVRDLRQKLVLAEVGIPDLPEALTRPFRERSGELGRVVSIDPPSGRDLWIAENLYTFSDGLRRITLPDGRIIESSGDAVIFADILREIRKDTPRTTALALAGVILVVVIALRGRRGAVHVVFALLVGVAWMIGLQALFDIKLNFFNFVALPTTFGIAADYAINLEVRYRELAGSRVERAFAALRSTGGAVALCSLTTMIGYYTLIIADNLALVSFGKLAMLGEATTLCAALVVLPATLVLDRRS